MALETPERVAVDFDVAGVGYRALAFLVDVGILFLWWIFVAFILGLLTGGDALGWFEQLGSVVQTVLVVAVFGVNWGYGMVFEWVWSGQTPGKRVVGLRVIRVDGGPYDFVTSAVRNLSRIVDGFPVNTYAVGLICATTTVDGRRLGDLLAGTVLVKDTPIDLSLYDIPDTEAAEPVGPALPELSPEAYEVVGGYLQRAAALEPEARERILRVTLDALADAAGLADEEAQRLRADPLAADAFLRRLVDRPVAVVGQRHGADALVRFVRERRPGWESLGRRLDALASGQLSLSSLAEVDRAYRRATSDLAWAQTFFPRTIPTLYLNRLCGRAYREIYRSLGNRREAVRTFYARTFPAAVWNARWQVLLSAGLFLMGGLAGSLLVAADPAVADAVLGPRMMHIVRSGQVWTDDLLSVAPPSLLSAKIFTNNISVTIVAFAGGLTAGVWTVVLLLLNGGLLGVAGVATAQHGVGLRLLDFVSAHGPAELSIVVLAGAAGLLVATALLAPGELSRSDALRVRGRDGVRIVLGTAPMLVVVGLVEGFVSPGTFFPTWVKLTLGLTLGGLLWVYLIRFGRRAARARST